MNWKAMSTRVQDLLSRKFLVFAIASVAMFMKLIDGWVWAGIAGVYLGVNLLQKKLLEKDPLNVG